MQIYTDLHTHTVASSHAFSTVQEYFSAAKARGIQLFACTDHAPSMPDAPHLWHFGNMKVLPRIVDDVVMLRGIEANILPDNQGVDIPQGLKPYLDIAIASLHEPVIVPGTAKANTAAVLAAFASGCIQVFGHPGNPNYPLLQEEIIRAAKDHNILIEINNASFFQSREGSEDNCLRMLELVDKLDWQVSFSSDAHSAFSLGDVSYCVKKAQQVGFPISRVVNRTPHALLNFLAEHHKPVVTELHDWLKNR